MIRKNKEDSDEQQAPAYMVLYSSLMTLLMTFFIVMVSMGKYGKEKFHTASVSVKEAFGVFAPREGGLLRWILNLDRVKPDFRFIDNRIVASQMDKTELLVGKIENFLGSSSNKAGVQDIQVKYLPQKGIIVKVSETFMFDLGQVKLKPKAEKFLDRLISLFYDQPYEIEVEGHTDNLPVSTNRYPSNWELSAGRAISVIRYLHEKGGIDYRYLRAIGYSEYRPLVENDTPEHRAMNRRIEIVLKKIKRQKERRL